jgi:cobalt-zinc-cadmium efflux system outer membrane protein
MRLLLRDVAAAFLKVLRGEEWLRITTAVEGVAAELARAAERRYRAGELPVLDSNAAFVAHARAQAEQAAAEAERREALGQLRALLGIDPSEPLKLEGDLRHRREPVLSELLAAAAERADIKVLRFSLRQAEAELRLGAAGAWPELGLGVQYRREAQDDVVLATVSLSVPIFERGQGLRATASARIRRLRLELEAAERASRTEIQTAFEVFRAQVQGAQMLERAIPKLDENDALALRAYSAGQIGLSELLLRRQQVLDARAAYLNQLFAAALAAIEAQARAGVLR